MEDPIQDDNKKEPSGLAKFIAFGFSFGIASAMTFAMLNHPSVQKGMDSLLEGRTRTVYETNFMSEVEYKYETNTIRQVQSQVVTQAVSDVEN